MSVSKDQFDKPEEFILAVMCAMDNLIQSEPPFGAVLIQDKIVVNGAVMRCNSFFYKDLVLSGTNAEPINYLIMD